MQPAKAGETAAKTQPKKKVAAPAKTTANDKAEQVLESTPLPFDAKNPTGEGLRALFKLSGTSEEGFAWHLGVGMPTIARWLKVEGPLNVRAKDLQVPDKGPEKAWQGLRHRLTKEQGGRNKSVSVPSFVVLFGKQRSSLARPRALPSFLLLLRKNLAHAGAQKTHHKAR